MSIQIRPCSHLNLIELAQLFSDSFAGYSVPVALDAQALARRVRREQLDLHRSVALFLESEPIGIALLGIRGERFWCGGFGIVPAHRGRGLANDLWRGMLAQVDGSLSLEVLANNSIALRFYLKNGMRKNRQLLILQGEGGGRGGLQERDPVPLILSHPRNQKPAWQRDIPALLSIAGLKGYATKDAYAVIESAHTIVDAGAGSPEAAAALISALSGPLRLINEPEDSPFRDLLPEIGRQFELVL